MRFVRTITGILLLTIGLLLMVVGGALWLVGRHRDAGGSFTAALERVQTSGYAFVVPDLDALLNAEAPFARTGRTRLRITGWTGDGPAFIGVAPEAEVTRYLATAPHTRIDRVSVTRGSLPVRVASVNEGQPVAVVGIPRDQIFWQGHGLGILDLASSDLRERQLSLVVMRPDGRAGMGVDLRGEIRPGWLDPVSAASLSGGVLLMLLGITALVWPVRPREVVFVVEPSQVPVLAGRLGVSALSDMGTKAGDRPGDPDPPPPERDRPDRPTAEAARPEPARRPAAIGPNGLRYDRPRAAKVLVPAPAPAQASAPASVPAAAPDPPPAPPEGLVRIRPAAPTWR